MRITLRVIAGPHKGRTFHFSRHDTFLVGRSRHAHFRLPSKDKFFSRIHFLMELNPPSCRLVDLGSHNGTFVNGTKVFSADLNNGDRIKAGHTTFRLKVESDAPELPPSNPALVLSLQQIHVPGYQVLREIGEGSLGKVYLARILTPPVLPSEPGVVALKTIIPATMPSSQEIQEFLDQARNLTQLDHPNLVKLRHLGETGGLFYFITEFVPGRDAAHFVKTHGPLPIARAIQWICQVLDALEYIHTQDMLHQAVKPANIMVQEGQGGDRIKLADCGLAGVYQAAPFSGLTVTRNNDALSFFPPEQVMHFGQTYPSADQYAAAASLYYLLTGQNVFDLPPEVHQRLTKLLTEKKVPIQERRPDIPPPLAAVIHKALARDPDTRFANVAEFRSALVEAMDPLQHP